MDTIKTVLISGAVVNFVLVILGAGIGLLLRKGFSERIKDTLIKGMSLCVVYVGVSGLFDGGIKPLVMILSVAIGAVIGEWFDLDKQVNRLGKWVEHKMGGNDGKIAEGFVTATLLFCIGAMTVVGSIDSGISGDNTTLYSKSVIDAIAGMALASSLGFGVMLSAIPVLVLEGGLTLLAVAVKPLLNGDVILQMSAVGSLLIIAIALNMMEVTKIKVMNILPAIFLPLLFCTFM
ncbi:MAG: DUF554 domain-containing protein [Clostridia bacterium]|nr:DUF554 domain-containing protein [Clostridia bacterium]